MSLLVKGEGLEAEQRVKGCGNILLQVRSFFIHETVLGSHLVICGLPLDVTAGEGGGAGGGGAMGEGAELEACDFDVTEEGGENGDDDNLEIQESSLTIEAHESLSSIDKFFVSFLSLSSNFWIWNKCTVTWYIAIQNIH